MKKIFLCFSIVALMASCSSDSDSSNNPNDPDVTDDVLVKKVVYNSITDDFSETINYTYNGKKLVKGVYADGMQEIYTYNGDLITKIEILEDGEVIFLETFNYDSSNRLIQYTSEEGSFTDVETFVYNNDGTVTSTIDNGGLVHTIHFQNEEISKIVDNFGHTYNYTYDGKNSPFKNVTGYDKIANVIHGDHEFFGRRQNITKIHETLENVDYMTNTMTYNGNNYPTTVTSVADFEGETYTATVQYTYN